MNGLFVDGEPDQPGPRAEALLPLPAYTSDELARPDARELLALLVRDEDRAPYNLIEACAARGEAMVKALHRAIDDERAWAHDADSGHWWLMLHAAMVLGRISSASAGLELVRLMRHLDRADDDALQDWLAGHWPALFANKPPAAIDAARALAEERTLGWYIRCQGVEVVVDAALRGGREVLERALDWVAAMAADETGDWDMRTSAASALLDFPRERHRVVLNPIADEEMRRVSKNLAILLPTFTAEDIDHAFARGRDEPGWKRRDDPWRFYLPQAITERQARWASENAEEWEHEIADLHLPYVRETPKVGRNDPCPCGSGKKYKKCCLLGGTT